MGETQQELLYRPDRLAPPPGDPFPPPGTVTVGADRDSARIGREQHLALRIVVEVDDGLRAALLALLAR